jgi:DNA-binding CsgD family transcriptional regulator
LLQEFLAVGHGPRALVLHGGPGIGKTTLWEAAIELGRRQGVTILATRASEADAQLSFAALADLLDHVDIRELKNLPGPQRHALEVAVLRAEPGPEPPEPTAISVGFLNALRALADERPLLVAIDDVPWLDRSSADVLTFAVRRVADLPVRFLFARRPGSPPDLERALRPLGIERVELEALSFGATRTLLSERLDLSLPRRVAKGVFESTGGNPLFALELGRVLLQRGIPEIGMDLPVPDVVDDLVGDRVAGLGDQERRALLTVALTGTLTRRELGAIVGAATLEDALDAGLVTVYGNRVRASHPLLAAAAHRRCTTRERRELHLELAEVMTDRELRAKHLALGTEHPDAAIAATVAAAGFSAAARAALPQAVELAAQALRLTPSDAAERTARVIVLGEYLEGVGELEQAERLLLAELDQMPSGEARVRAFLVLAECARSRRSEPEQEKYVDLALDEAADDAGLRARVLPAVAQRAGETRMEEREALALEALSGASGTGPDVERDALVALAWARAKRGMSIDDLCARFQSQAYVHVGRSPERPAAQRLAWRGEIAEARHAHRRLLSAAEEKGDALLYDMERLHLCEIDLRTGNWEEAARCLEEWDNSLHGEFLGIGIQERCRALLAAGRGLPHQAEAHAAKAMDVTEPGWWDWLEASRAIGIVALLEHDHQRAAEHLRPVWEHTEREGIDDPGVFPVAPELVEALVELNEAAEARAVAERLCRLAQEQDHPWGRATAKRCAALIQLARGYDDGAVEDLAGAAACYASLELRFEHARTLLLLGRVQRRYRKWAAARATLEQAAAAFAEIGSPGWSEDAQSELQRVAARRPAPKGALTSTEDRVARLAAEGLSNKQIAAKLVVTVNTVEKHLSHAYEKLGIQSRGQLAARLRAPG